MLEKFAQFLKLLTRTFSSCSRRKCFEFKLMKWSSNFELQNEEEYSTGALFKFLVRDMNSSGEQACLPDWPLTSLTLRASPISHCELHSQIRIGRCGGSKLQFEASNSKSDWLLSRKFPLESFEWTSLSGGSPRESFHQLRISILSNSGHHKKIDS